MDNKKRVIIVGSGPSGYSAAIYAARANLDVTIITGYQIGGQLTTTTEVENWIGGREGLTGNELMENMLEHVERFDVEIIEDLVSEIIKLEDGTFKLIGDFLGEYHADAVIIASGSSAKYLGLESEKEFLGRGVSGCATCDGYFYKDLPVTVIGGGNTAVEEALYLSTISSNVTLIHRGSKLRAEQILQDALFSKDNITVKFNSEVKEFVGVKDLEKVILTNGEELEVKGAFIAIGHTPNTKFLNGLVQLSDDGHIITHNGTHTSVEGIFACGDVMHNVYRQAIISAGTGCIASLDVQKYLENC